MVNNTKIEDKKFLLLKGWANKMAAYYYSPVYLIGSSITNAAFKDVDILIIIEDEYFTCRYGNIKEWRDGFDTGNFNSLGWQMTEECFKRWKNAYLFTGLNIDLKILPQSYFKEVLYKANVLRLDQSAFF